MIFIFKSITLEIKSFKNPKRGKMPPQDEMINSFLENYKCLIPSTTIVYIDLIDQVDISVREWHDECRGYQRSIKFKASMIYNYTQNSRVFKISFDIYMSYKPNFFEIETCHCYGHKCRYSEDWSINKWCIDCWDDPDERDLSELLELMFILKEGLAYEDPKVLKFSHIKSIIERCVITSVEEIS